MPPRKNGKPKHPGGRPNEGRVKLTVHVLPETSAAIRAAMTDQLNTLGKVVDLLCKVQKSAKAER